MIVRGMRISPDKGMYELNIKGLYLLSAKKESYFDADPIDISILLGSLFVIKEFSMGGYYVVYKTSKNHIKFAPVPEDDQIMEGIKSNPELFQDPVDSIVEIYRILRL